MEQPVLLPEGLDVCASVRLFRLERHVRVLRLSAVSSQRPSSVPTHRDLRDRRKVEDERQDEDEDGDGEIGPLDVLQAGIRIVDGIEEDVGAQDRRDDGPDPVERLRDIDPDLAVLGRTADGQIRVCRRLERAQAVARDEDGDAEAAKGAVHERGPGNQRADAVQAEAPDEARLVAVVPQDPVGVAERGQRVRAKVGGLEARAARAGDVQDFLEVLVEGVDEAVGEALGS